MLLSLCTLFVCLSNQFQLIFIDLSYVGFRKIPYQEKHVLQQASILGNLEKFGVLKESCLSSGGTSEECDSGRQLESDGYASAVVEFGAGRGYLTQMLADCYGIKKVLLVERKSYKLKVSIEINFMYSCPGKNFSCVRNHE